MYDELVKRLRLVAQWADKGLVIPPSVCLEAADAIEELSRKTREVYRWIPVTERLPEDGSDVLAYLKFANNSRIAAANYYKETWMDCVMDRLYLTGDGFVTHWMPLPEPPKEKYA